jgi:hypothetical protein
MADEPELANVTIFLNFIRNHRRPARLLALLRLHLFNRG